VGRPSPSNFPVGKAVGLAVALVMVICAGFAVFEVVARLGGRDSGGSGVASGGNGSLSSNNSRVTLENFNRLRDQMTLAEVEEILGKETVRAENDGIVSCRWSNGDDYINVQFADGKLVKRVAGIHDTSGPLSQDKSGGDPAAPERSHQMYLYRRATSDFPEARKDQPDPDVLTRQVKDNSMFLFDEMSTEEIIAMLRMGREQGWPSGADEIGAKYALTTGKLVTRSDAEFLYRSVVDDHPEIATVESPDAQLAQKIKAGSIFFEDYTTAEVIDILKMGRELSQQANK